MWTLAEDALDKHAITRIEARSHNPAVLFTAQFLNPARGTANMLRFRPPWFRDTRTVKASTFWSQPPPPTDAEAASILRAEMLRRSEPVRQEPLLPEWPHPGGIHEFGAWWGLSLISGHLWGDAKDVKYMPIDVRYSYLLSEHERWALRYAPELTALAMLDEPVPNQTDPELQRKRTYGSGLSPFGFQTVLFPDRRTQPFLSSNAGLIRFTDRVLSPPGSQWIYTADFGCGIQIFRKPRQSVSIGYRYQHLASTTDSHHPATDANTFYVSASRFRNEGLSLS